MPLNTKSGREDEEFTFYASLINFKSVVMALDHFFEEVIQGNVPLTDEADWWERQIVPERVNRYSRRWCVLFEAAAVARGRLIEQGIPLHNLVIDENLVATVESGRHGIEEITWRPQEGRR